jgi:hypothetical protein
VLFITFTMIDESFICIISCVKVNLQGLSNNFFIFFFYFFMLYVVLIMLKSPFKLLLKLNVILRTFYMLKLKFNKL